jgi:alpha-N-arabinofuranosidase
MPTQRDAVFSGMTLDIFNRHPEKVAMANCAQLVNCLNSLYLAHGDKFVVTPVGHVFGMYAAHQGGQALRTIFSSPAVNYDRDGKPATFWGLKGSTSLQGKQLVLTVVNPHVREERPTEVGIRGASIRSGSITTLKSSDIHAHNTFDQPNVVAPQTTELQLKGKVANIVFPPASVTKLTLLLE